MSSAMLKSDLTFMGCRQQMQTPCWSTRPWRYPTSWRFQTRLEARDLRGNSRFVILFVVATRDRSTMLAGLASKNTRLRSAWVANMLPLPGNAKPNGFSQAVHGIGGEHARTGPAGGTGRPLIGQGFHFASDIVGSAAATMASIRSRDGFAVFQQMTLCRLPSDRRRQRSLGCSGASPPSACPV